MGFTTPITPNVTVTFPNFINDLPTGGTPFTVTQGPASVYFTAGPDYLMVPTDPATLTPSSNPFVNFGTDIFPAVYADSLTFSNSALPVANFGTDLFPTVHSDSLTLTVH